MADLRLLINCRLLIAGLFAIAIPLQASSNADVADAAKARDAAAVKVLLRSGADVNAAQGDGMTALHWAASNGDAALTQMLLAAGANIRATTRLGGITPLLMASQAGHAQVVATLLAAGAEANSATATGASALMLAARSGSTETVTRLVETGADINAKEKGFGQTALMVAAGLDRADVVRLLLARGADWKAASAIADLKALSSPIEDGSGRPGPAPAAAPGRIDVAGVTRGYRYNELIGTQGGLTALHFAARQGSFTAAKALVEGGVDVNLVSPGDQASPLLVALINGHFDLAAYLLDKGARADLLSDAGVSPLYAVLNVQWAPIAAYPQPRSHLQQARGYLDVMKLLLDKGADPNARVRRKVWYSGYNFDQSGVDEAGATAFWRAAYAADVAAMKLLVSYGADPTLPTMKLFSRRGPEDPTAGADKSGLPPIVIGGPGAMPLHAAAGPGYAMGFAGNSHHVAPAGMLPAVKYLVEELGADVNAVDADGNSVVHNAASRGDTEMIRYLVSKGADVKKINRSGQTTIDVANGPVQRTQPYPETIKLLESLGATNNHKCVSC
ncbi:MAG TPA: ankyrin repeat domain-containing protein [Vicinamibacterales bacterium]|nr:ankyrin repeat domain-containing protein [Vicinamibacterales bacterium]